MPRPHRVLLLVGLLASCAPAAPRYDQFRLLGGTTLTPPENAENQGVGGLALKDGVLLVAQRTGTLLAYDLGTDPVATLTKGPTASAQAVTGGNGVAAMVVQGKTAWFVSNGILARIDVTDPRAPRTIDTLGAALPGGIIAANERVLALAGGPGLVQLVDLTTEPPVIHPRKPLAAALSITGLAVEGTRLYLTESTTRTVRVYDVTDPATPTELGFFTTPLPELGVTHAPNPAGLLVKGTTVYAFGVNTRYVLDASDPTAIVQLNADAGAGYFVNDIYFRHDGMQGAFLTDTIVAWAGSTEADAGSFTVHLFDLASPTAIHEFDAHGAGSYQGIRYLVTDGTFIYSSAGADLSVTGESP